MIRIALIRHSKTKGNIEERYIGSTDEGLCNEGIDLINTKLFPKVEAVYCSPLSRCIETAQLIYKEIKPTIYNDLKECDFGLFENKNYKELEEDISYKEWIESKGTLPFPNGESAEGFQNRCIDEFDKIIIDIFQNNIDTSAMVVHGGTIMAILDKYSSPHEDFFYWQVKNCEGFVIEIDKNLWNKGDKQVTIMELI